jgi:very-short-patch-repair endonuclease
VIALANVSTSNLTPSPLQRGISYTPQIVNINGDSPLRTPNGDKKSKALTTFNSQVFSMRYLPYNKDLKEFSRNLRNNSTPGEILLWKKLRAGTMMTYSFNRQKPLNKCMVDFYCKPLNLVIEVDGEYHNDPVQRVKDKERQEILESMKLNFLRFSEQQVR